MRARTTLVVALMVVGAVALAGCGGGSDGDSASESTTTEATDATTPTDDGGTDSGGTTFVASEDCRQLAEAFDQNQFSDSFTNGDDPTKDLEQAAEFLHQAADDAPDEIADDVETLANAYDDLAERSAGVDWEAIQQGDLDAVAAATRLATAFADTDFLEAATNLTQWTAEHCTR